MAQTVRNFVTLFALALATAFNCSGQERLAKVVRQYKPYTTTVALKFSKKNQNLIWRTFSVIAEPNGHATGFFVGDGLVMTSYHVVSGKLSSDKKKLLGFKPSDEIAVRAYVNDCEAKVVKVDERSDLALLSVCPTKRPEHLVFRKIPSRDEQLFMIAQPGEWKVVLTGKFRGRSTFAGNEYWAAKIEGQDGFSGSPVYNQDGELVGVFSLYDFNQGVALLSPSAKAQEFLADYDLSVRSQP